MIEILPADFGRPNHADALIQLLDAYAREPMGGGQGLAEGVKVRLPTALAERSGTVVLLAWEEREPIGLLIAFEGFSTFACRPLFNIHDLFVSAAHRGRGVARQLFARLEEFATDRGCCKLTLEVLDENREAQATYRRLGFRPYELSPEAGRAVLWQKSLSIRP
ncbi:MAG: GNAT family N-acetyltransferase [Planctomycetaceae bacterium]|nr:MAG: GNAT family N-acetyltransferase [Planctomycetaceae bacterium]